MNAREKLDNVEEKEIFTSAILNNTLTMDPAALIHPNISKRSLRPNLSDKVPMKTLDMATPINVHRGMK